MKCYPYTATVVETRVVHQHQLLDNNNTLVLRLATTITNPTTTRRRIRRRSRYCCTSSSSSSSFLYSSSVLLLLQLIVVVVAVIPTSIIIFLLTSNLAVLMIDGYIIFNNNNNNKIAPRQQLSPSYFSSSLHYLKSSSSSSTQKNDYVTYDTVTTTASTMSQPTTTTTTTTTTNGAAVAVATTTSTTTEVVPASATSCISSVQNWEIYWIELLQHQYNEALQIKCPFFRRRASDVLDACDMILQFIIIRHKSIYLPFIDYIDIQQHGRSSISSSVSGNYIQQRSSFAPSTTAGIENKLYNISIDEILAILKEDWKIHTNKGYYVTGKLNTCIYDNDTIFDGPDPDMPVRGLYKYINAASQLFDTKYTFCQLLSMEQQQQQQLPEQLRVDGEKMSTKSAQQHPTSLQHNNISNNSNVIIIAKWKMHGRLRLPWKPIVPEWTGTTYYYIHPITGLIYQHIETWDISVLQAFVQTLLPKKKKLSMTQYLNNNDDNNNRNNENKSKKQTTTQ